MLIKKQFIAMLGAVACLLLTTGCAGRQAGFTLTLAHINDTHGHLSPVPLSFKLDNDTIRTEAAGFPRLAAILKKYRKSDKELVFLHAGDVFTGTLFFSRFGGRADCNLLNALGLDAMALGNHEFDRGPRALADFADQANFALLAANIDASKEPLLRDRIKPYIIKNIRGAKVGIIGIAQPDTPQLSRPGQGIVFNDPVQSARQAIQALVAQGVHAIIVVSHLGYSKDMELAPQLPEVDIIAGGHTHTLLGDFSALGFQSQGPYPTVCKNADNATVLVVQAGEWAKIVGVLKVTFDAAGKVTAWEGGPRMPVGTSFTQGNKMPVSRDQFEKIKAKLSRSPGITCIDEDAGTRKLLEPYASEVAFLYKQKITQAPADIAHVRMPGGEHAGGSDLVPLVADSMLWKLRAGGQEVDASLTNAGAVRGSIPAGEVTVGQIKDLLPFGDTLVLCRLSGSEIRQVLESAIDRALSSAESGAFPYVAGLRYTADFSLPLGKRLLKIELQDSRGRWRALVKKSYYRMVTNSYLARGREGYGLLAGISKRTQDTGFGDAEAFIEYAARQLQLKCLPETCITVVRPKK